jgi:3',5'-cyclic AMP phosphodiesterase CpdA
LSDVPYTGAGDVVRVISFILALISWSMFVAVILLRKKVKVQLAEITLGKSLKTENENYNSTLSKDENDIASIENFARENKILLSTDAATKLVKFERLNKVNAKNLLKKASGNTGRLSEKRLKNTYNKQKRESGFFV